MYLLVIYAVDNYDTLTVFVIVTTSYFLDTALTNLNNFLEALTFN
jgi:hypothetical protein